MIRTACLAMIALLLAGCREPVAVTANVIECEQSQDLRCVGAWEPTGIYEFRPIIERQSVIRKRNLGNMSFLDELKDCRVFDVQNWECATSMLLYLTRDGEVRITYKDLSRSADSVSWFRYQYVEHQSKQL